MLSLEKFQSDKNVKNLNSKVVFISHNDLDGAGPIIVGTSYYNKDCVRYFTIANNSVNKIVKMVLFAPEYNDADLILITDVSITDVDLANTITEINKHSNKSVFLFDHHTTALWLNNYDWAVITQEEGISGTLLYYNYFRNVFKILRNDNFYSQFCKVISDWDTWMWTKHNDIIPKELSVLYSKTGINYFLNAYANRNDTEFKLFTEKETALLKDIQTKEKYVIIPSVKRTIEDIEVHFNFCYTDAETNECYCINEVRKVRCVCVSDAPSDLAEQLFDDGIDFVFMFYSNGTLSCRSRVDDIHLGEWAKAISNGKGGGHLRSAGFTMDTDTFWIYGKYLNQHYSLNNKLV